VATSRGLRAGYLPQRPKLQSERTLYQEMLSLFDALRAQQAALHTLTEQLVSEPDSVELLERYAADERDEHNGKGIGG